MIPRRIAILIVAVLGWHAPAAAVNYTWIGGSGGQFRQPNLWMPFNPSPPPPSPPLIGPGGASDTAIFTLGFPTAARYTVTDVMGENHQLIVRVDSLTLEIADLYHLQSTDVVFEPTFVVGTVDGGTADVILTGDHPTESDLFLRRAVIGSVEGSTGIVTVDSLLWGGIEGLFVGSSGSGTLTIQNSSGVSHLFSRVGVNFGATGTVTVRGAGSLLVNSTELTIGYAGTGTLMIEAGGRVTSTFGAIAGNATSAIGTAIVTGPDSAWLNSGELRVGYIGTGTLRIEAGGSVSNEDANVGLAPTANGTVTVTGIGSTWTIDGRLSIGGSADTGANGGTGVVTIQPGATVSAAEEIVLFPDGRVELGGGTLTTPEVSFQGGGTFDFLSGTLHVDEFHGNLVNQGGALVPGESIGATTISGNYSQQAAATLEIEVGGILPGQFDTLTVTGNAILHGVLDVALIDAFEPVLGNTFTILRTEVGNVGGRFATENLPVFGDFTLEVVYNPQSVVLEVVELPPPLPGDFNGNGAVENADLTLLLNNWGNAVPPTPAGWVGTPLTAPAVDNDELTALLNNWGSVAGTGAIAASAVPEPASCTLVSLAILLVLARPGVPRNR